MELFVSAGDASSETHGAAAVAALRRLDPALTVFGLGGDNLKAAGAELLMHSREFSVGGGPLEILSRLPRRGRLERLLEDRLFQRRPQAALLIDNGEINLRLAALLNFFRVPVVYYIPPKVWVWRSSRLEQIYSHVRLVLGILPFEKEIYEGWGIPFQYVGNPLLDELPLSLSADEARSRLRLPAGRAAVAVLPGSRHSEIRFHTPIFAEAMARFSGLLRDSAPESLRDPLFLLPVPATVDFEAVNSGFTAALAGSGVELRCLRGQSHEAMKASRAALIKSGTSTLEAGALGVPMVVAYQTGRLARFIFHNIIRYKHPVGLVNLYLTPEGPPAAEECILERCTAENLAQAWLKIYLEGHDRDKQAAALGSIPSLLRPPAQAGPSPSEAVAKALHSAMLAGKAVTIKEGERVHD